MNQIKPVYKNRDMKVTFAFRNFANASKITEDKKLKAEINPTLQQKS